MTPEEKRAQGKRNKNKGARNERRTRDYFYEIGASIVMKTGGSLGEFDLVAFFPGEVILAQVKTNAWPGPQERAAMRAVCNYSYCKKLMVRWDDGEKTPTLKTLPVEEVDKFPTHERKET